MFLEKSFEVGLYNKNSAFMVMLVLDLFEANGVTEK